MFFRVNLKNIEVHVATLMENDCGTECLHVPQNTDGKKSYFVVKLLKTDVL